MEMFLGCEGILVGHQIRQSTLTEAPHTKTEPPLEVVRTADGSSSVRHTALGESYHSGHGALSESLHVFIHAGLLHVARQGMKVRVYEAGLGTGLNAVLTARAALRLEVCVQYAASELYPLPSSLVSQLNFGFDSQESEWLMSIHESPWEQWQHIAPHFELFKMHSDFSRVKLDTESFDVVYFDAFSPRVQPGLWTPQVFANLYKALKPGGVLVTYCAKGQVRRDMLGCGFGVERLPGPPGKREMLRMTKPR